MNPFLADPLDAPTLVVDYLATQLQIEDASCVKRYLERRNTRYQHQAEIARAYGYDFGAAEVEFLRWLEIKLGPPVTGRRRCARMRSPRGVAEARPARWW